MAVSFGILVTDVRKGGPAETAGILKDDVIQYFNGEKIRAPGDLIVRVQEAKTDTTARIRLVRGRKTGK